jgi:membrane protein
MTIRELGSTFKRTAKEFFEKDTFEMGAALAYYTVFSLAPLVLLALAIAGLVFEEKVARDRMTTELLNSLGPEVAAAIEKTVASAGSSARSGAASVIGIAVLLFGASGVFVQLQSAVNKIWEVKPKKSAGIWGFIRNRLLSFAMVLGIGFLLLVSLVVSAAISAMSSYLAPGQTAVYQVLNQLISFGIITLLFAVIFKFLPDCQVDWSDVWAGAALTALLFTVGKYLLGLYLTSVASAYGAAGSLVMILVWVYYASQILLFGAQFTQVFASHGRATPLCATENRSAPERGSADVENRGENARATAH